MFKRRLRQINRYRDIVTTFTRHGFGFLVEELGLHHMLPVPRRFRKEESREPKPAGMRLRLAFEELGPTFIKFGQLLSTRPDVVPEDFIRELDKLQDRVESFTFQEAREIIENELSDSLENLFAWVEQEPVAAASIGQVHKARLKDGREVVIKVQRPGVTALVETDLEILSDIVSLAGQRFDFVTDYNLKEIVNEFSLSIRKELNYTMEARSAEKFSSIFQKDEDIYIPQVYWEYTTKRVITMERIEGVHLNDLKAIQEAGYDRQKIARRLTESFLEQVLIEGFFHGDPHPGNFLILPGEVIGFTDFGIAGQLTPELKDRFASLMLALIHQDVDRVVKNIMKIGLIPDDVNINRLKRDVMIVRDKYYHLPLKEISFGEAIEDFFDIAYRHKIQIPSELTLLGKTFLTLEGVVSTLDPEISVVEIAEPFGAKMTKEKMRPSNIWETITSSLLEYGEMMIELPGEVREFVRVLKRGKGRLEIQVPQLEATLKKLDRISNRLSFSIVLLAFSIIMTGLVIAASLQGQHVIFWQVPAVEVGFGIAFVMFLWMLYSIFRSGRL